MSFQEIFVFVQNLGCIVVAAHSGANSMPYFARLRSVIRRLAFRKCVFRAVQEPGIKA